MEIKISSILVCPDKNILTDLDAYVEVCSDGFRTLTIEFPNKNILIVSLKNVYEVLITIKIMVFLIVGYIHGGVATFWGSLCPICK
ncbi:MAG: hypothetical protein RR140_02475 [Clostridia bacterium]